MMKAYAFPASVRQCGLLGLLGLAAFVSSVTVLHLTSSGIDWTRDYVSNPANQPLGGVLMTGTFLHGWGNLALTMGLRGALRPGRLRIWGRLLFALAQVISTVGIHALVSGFLACGSGWFGRGKSRVRAAEAMTPASSVGMTQTSTRLRSA